MPSRGGMKRQRDDGGGGRNQTTKRSKKDFSSRGKSLFDTFAKGKEIMGETEIEDLCKCLQVDTEDPILFALAWRMKCQEVGAITRDEFETGCDSLGAVTLSALRGSVKILQKDLQTNLRAIYRFCFNYCKDNNAKFLDAEIGFMVMEILLPPSLHRSRFISFLQMRETKCLSSDQWLMWVDFSNTVLVDFSNYDPAGPWPVLFDEYVSWAKEQEEKEREKEKGGGGGGEMSLSGSLEGENKMDLSV